MNEVTQVQQSWDIAPTAWNELVTEVRRLNAELNQKKELTFEDLQLANRMAKGIRESGTKYRRHLLDQATAYNEQLEKALADIGYTPIANYITQMDTQRKQLVAKRMTDKITYFVNTVNQMLAGYPNIMNSTLAPVFANTVMGLFPKINSGAKGKEIKDWQPIFTEVNRLAMELEQLYIALPILRLLPIASASVQEVCKGLRGGYIPQQEDLQNALLIDKYAIEQIQLKATYQTPDQVVQLLSETLAADATSEAKIHRIKYLLSIL